MKRLIAITLGLLAASSSLGMNYRLNPRELPKFNVQKPTLGYQTSSKIPKRNISFFNWKFESSQAKDALKKDLIKNLSNNSALQEAKLALLDRFHIMLEHSPEKITSISENMALSSPRIFCEQILDYGEKILLREIEKNHITAQELEKETLYFDELEKEQAEIEQSRFKPASLAIQRFVSEHKKYHNINHDLSVVQASRGFAHTTKYFVHIHENAFSKYPKASQRFIIDHELTHIKKNDTSRVSALAHILNKKEKFWLWELSPERQELYLLYQRFIETRADLISASRNRTNMEGYKNTMDQFVNEYGYPDDQDTHPPLLHRHCASALLLKVDDLYNKLVPNKYKLSYQEELEYLASLTNKKNDGL